MAIQSTWAVVGKIAKRSTISLPLMFAAVSQTSCTHQCRPDDAVDGATYACPIVATVPGPDGKLRTERNADGSPRVLAQEAGGTIANDRAWNPGITAVTSAPNRAGVALEVGKTLVTGGAAVGGAYLGGAGGVAGSAAGAAITKVTIGTQTNNSTDNSKNVYNTAVAEKGSTAQAGTTGTAGNTLTAPGSTLGTLSMQ